MRKSVRAYIRACMSASLSCLGVPVTCWQLSYLPCRERAALTCAWQGWVWSSHPHMFTHGACVSPAVRACLSHILSCPILCLPLYMHLAYTRGTPLSTAVVGFTHMTGNDQIAGHMLRISTLDADNVNLVITFCHLPICTYIAATVVTVGSHLST